jgi:hypothetical protein
MDEKPISPATRALMCDEEHEIGSEKETSARVKTSQEKEDTDTSSGIYLEQERQILSIFRDYLIQLSNRARINGNLDIVSLFRYLQVEDCANLRHYFKQVKISKATQIQVERNQKMKNKAIETQIRDIA